MLVMENGEYRLLRGSDDASDNDVKLYGLGGRRVGTLGRSRAGTGDSREPIPTPPSCLV